MSVSSEGAADELRRAVFFLCHGQPCQIEDGFQIAIAMHQVHPRSLEITFRQFGLNQKTPQLEVDFRSVLGAALQGDPRSETKARPNTGRKAEKGTERRPAKHPWVAKDVHQQRVGTVGAFQFAPGAIAASGNKAGTGIDLGKARSPVGLLENLLVGSGEKVAVFSSFVFAVDHAGYRAIGHLSAQVGCPLGIAVTQFAAQRSWSDGE